MLAAANLAWTFEEVDVFQPPEQRLEAFRSLSRFGEAPLLAHDGRPYMQSNAILLHLAARTGRFGAEPPARLALAREWLFWEANRLAMSLPHLRYAKRFAQDAYPAGALEWLHARWLADIAHLDAELADGRAFVLGDGASIADFSLCGYLFWAGEAGLAVPAGVQAWLGRIAALSGWRAPHELLRKV